MDNFKSVYKILTALEKAMDLPEFDISQVGPEALGVTQERWNRYIEENAQKTHGKAPCACMVLFSYPRGKQNGRMLQVLQPKPHRGQGGRLHGPGPVPYFPLTHPRSTRIFSFHFR